MAIRYLFGTEDNYQQLLSQNKIDDWAFYRTVNTSSENKLKNLYFGTKLLTSAEDVNNVLELIGDLSTLRTNDKKCLVNAINEIIATGGGSVSIATNTTPGIMKLYQETGNAIDGTISQAKLTEILNKKAEIDGVSDDTLIFNKNN